MLDEEMDDIIRNAAAKHHPAYNDEAWDKMEAQLDKHLPQKRDRRKFIFFLLFFLLLGGGAFFTVIHFTENRSPADNAVAEKKGDKQLLAETPVKLAETPVKNVAPINNEDPENAAAINSTKPVTGNPVNDAVNNNAPQQNKKNNSSVENVNKNKKAATVNKGRSNIGIVTADLSEDVLKDKNENAKNNRSKTDNTAGKMNAVITTPEPENEINENAKTIPADIAREKNTVVDEQKKEAVKPKGEVKEKEDVIAKKSPVSPEKKKPKNNFAGNFGITVSAGPDLSFVSLNKLGKATLTYGAGLSYNFAKRVTVRTGFYFSKKIYSATPDQYHTTGGVVYPNLYEVDADCKIYEIPVSLSYSFWQKKNHNWFGAVGLSSFLMKNEKYDYVYKTAYGQTYNYKAEINNENKHYFSVLTLSAGYQYHLSKRVSIQAEPYVKLPLGGVGLGKIKLNSSGILLTATIKPFAKRK